MGMFDNDIIFGGARLDETVILGEPYVLFDCGVIAENVTTSLGTDGVKVELVIAPYNADLDPDSPASPAILKVGTFASSIVTKVKQKADGDLPAVVRFERVESKYDSDALVMTFIARYAGKAPKDLPAITAINLTEDIPF